MKHRRSLAAGAAAIVAAATLLLSPGATPANPSVATDAGPAGNPAAVGVVAAQQGMRVSATEYFTSGQPQWWCPSGAVCFYTSWDGTGDICYSYGDVSSSGCGWRLSYFNNGTACWNCDHVYVRDASNAVHCLHYGWTEGRGTMPTWYQIVAYWWGGEC